MIRRLLTPKRSAPAPEYAGNCDLVEDGVVHGWAWLPSAPEAPVEVEQWVDGVLKARSLADLPRDDLAAAGIGDGAHGWRMLLGLDPRKTDPQKVEVRFSGGGPVPNGAFEMTFGRQPETEPEPASALARGHCDGLREGVAPARP